MTSAPGNQVTLTHASARPITRRDLYRMVDACDPDTLAGARDRALLVYAWQTRATRAALVAARIDTVPLDQLDDITIDDITDSWCLPTRDLLTDWLLALAIELGQPVLTGPLFRPVNQHGHLTTRQHLSGEGVNHIVHRAVRRAHLRDPERYSTLSLYHGGRLGL